MSNSECKHKLFKSCTLWSFLHRVPFYSKFEGYIQFFFPCLPPTCHNSIDCADEGCPECKTDAFIVIYSPVIVGLSRLFYLNTPPLLSLNCLHPVPHFSLLRILNVAVSQKRQSYRDIGTHKETVRGRIRM